MRNGLIRLSRAALCVAACFGATATVAAPTLPKVVAGKATFAQDGNVFSITNTPGTIINWQSFSVNAGEVTRFIQQNADSAVLNRITGQDPSRILGALQSNGKVFLINPNGVVFGSGSRVDVNGLVASTLDMSDADFLAGKKNFTAGPNAGKVRNDGAITTPSGGKVFLVAPNVENSGVITAPNGDVVLAAGRSVQLVDSGNPDLTVVVSAPLDQAINLGQVVSNGGRIGIYGALVNQRGVVNANSAVVGQDGRIVLKASKEATLEQGSVTSATGAGKGGEIGLLGERVALRGNAQVDASGALGGGTVLAGGDYQGRNAALPNAQQTSFSKDAGIRADATNAGNGGKVVLWADGATAAHGSISARGAGGGNGGLVETSGRQLDIAGIRVNAGAGQSGRTGTWLIDPTNIEVSSSVGTATDTTYINADTLTATNADIVLQATNDLRIKQNISTAHSVRAEAGHDLEVGAAVRSTGGDIDLRAGNRITLAAGSALASPNYIDLKAERMTLTGDIGGLEGTTGILPVISFNTAKPGTEIDVRVSEAARNALYLNPNRLGAFGAYEINIGNSGQTGGVIISNPLTMAGNLVIDTAYTLNVNSQVLLTGETSQFIGTVHEPFGSAAMVSSAGSITARKKISILGADGVQIVNTVKSDDIEISAASNGIQIYSDPYATEPSLKLDAGKTLTLRTPGRVYQDEGALLKAPQLLVEGGTVEMLAANQVGTLAGRSTGLEDSALLAFHWTGDLKVGSVAGVTGLQSAGPLSLTGGALRADAGIEGSALVIDAASIGGSGLFKADAMSLTSRGGIGASTGALNTSATALTATNTASGSAPINIVNDRALVLGDVVQDGSGNAGAISIETTGGLTVAPTSGDGRGVKTVSGDISLVTHSPLTILGKVSTDSGNVRLVADNGGLLTIGAAGQVSSSTGSVSVTAGDTAIAANGIVVSDPAKLSVVKTNPPKQPEPEPPRPAPPLDTCLSNPNTTGCSGVIEQATRNCITNPEGAQCPQVLPPADSCRSDPTKLGCGVVLVRECIASPKAPGCGEILPPYGTCEKTPATYGCAPVVAEYKAVETCIATPKAPSCVGVLPVYGTCEKSPNTHGCAPVVAEYRAIEACIATPKAPSCVGVLPVYDTCEKSPTTHGCAPVVAEYRAVEACIATPKAPSCAGVLPVYDTCEKSPATHGCAPVVAEYKAVEACIATPKAPSCAGVLPVYDTCAKSPATHGCAPVVAEYKAVEACIATPKAPSCAGVLPVFAACEKSPTTHGCAPVIAERNAIAACIASPKAAGCAETLPTLTSCRVDAGLYGCVPVLERAEFVACVANPGAAGCTARLPALPVCKATPGEEGCGAVLQVAFDRCLATPHDASCSGILPTLSQCVSNKTAAGCQVVLPSLQQCIGSPTLQGCSVQLPKLEQCAVNPTLAGCEAVLPKPDFCSTHPTDPTCVVFNPGTGQVSQQTKPVAEAQQTAVTLINTRTPASPAKPPVAAGTPESSNTAAASGTGTDAGASGGEGGGKPSEGTESTAGPAQSTNSGAKNEKPATKMYCN